MTAIGIGAAAGQALFYPKGLTANELQLMIVGLEAGFVVDEIVFSDEAGGEQERQFALPYLPGMDAVEVRAANLAFRVGDRDTQVEDYAVSPGPSGKGVVLTLDRPARLRKLELEWSDPPADPEMPAPLRRLIVRPMDTGTAGPPIFAAPDFVAPGPTFGRVLTGMTWTALTGDRKRIGLPDLLGRSWLFQIATGDDATGLAPNATAIAVRRVIVAGAPQDLAVTLAGDPPTPLWSSPGLLLPDSGRQEVSFLPIAQRRLNEALAVAPANALTLPLTLRFASAAAGKLDVLDRALEARYLARPLGDTPVTLRLGGRPARLVLDAPALRRPTSGSVTLVAKLLGRALNGGSREAPAARSGHGLRADAVRTVATAVKVAQRPGVPAATPVPLASVALRLGTGVPTELAVELRADTAGRPGAALAAAMVRQFEAGFDDWIELVLPVPLVLAPGSTCWVAVRTTKGAALWHADPAAPPDASAACVSADRGGSWTEASRTLRAAEPPLVQLFHVEDAPVARPGVRVAAGPEVLAADWLVGAVADSATQFRLTDAAVPPAVLAKLGAAVAPAGGARAATELLLSSASVMDLVLGPAVLAYDPGVAT